MRLLKYILAFQCAIFCASSFAQNSKLQHSTDSIINLYLSQVNTDSISSYITHLQNFVTRLATVDSTRRPVAKWIQDKFLSFGYTDVQLDSFLFSTKWQYNVICNIQGTINPDKNIVLGAHHDSRSDEIYLPAPGADDNASGVAGVLEAARIIRNNNYQNPLTIKFVTFAAEEYGMYGSQHFVDDCVASGSDIKMMINFDMISYTVTDTVDSVWFISLNNYPNGQWLLSLADSVTEKYTILNPYHKSGSSNSDSGPFDEAGFSAIFLQEYYGPYSSPVGHNPYFHTINDIIDNCDIYYCSQIIKVGLGMLLKSADTLTDINELTEPDNDKITIYPIPTRNEISINIHNYDKSTLQIKSLTGQLLYRCQLNKPLTKVQVDFLDNGIYFFEISTKTFNVVKKIIISK